MKVQISARYSPDLYRLNEDIDSKMGTLGASSEQFYQRKVAT